MNSPGGPRSGVIRDVTGRGRVSCAVVGLLRKIDTSFKEERLRCGGSTFFYTLVMPWEIDRDDDQPLITESVVSSQ